MVVGEDGHATHDGDGRDLDVDVADRSADLSQGAPDPPELHRGVGPKFDYREVLQERLEARPRWR